MKRNMGLLLGGLALSTLGYAQSTIVLLNSAEAPARTVAQQQPQSLPGTMRLTLKDAEAIALKNNPAISVARLNALASQQVTREVRSNLWPQAYGNLTAVDTLNNSRITAGELNNPTVFTRAAAGVNISQLITDFGHTSNLIAGARLQAQADEQNAAATKQQVLLAVDE